MTTCPHSAPPAVQLQAEFAIENKVGALSPRSKRGRLVWLLASALILLLAAPAVFAQACSISVQPVLAFGAYDPVQTTPPVDGLGLISVDCDKNKTVDISLSTGSGTFALRTLRKTPETLNYNLYTSPSYSAIWGDGTAGTSTVGASIRKNQSMDFPIYGRIPAGQNVGVGAYSDTIGITMTF